MNKIKINKKVETGIKSVAMLSMMKGSTAHDFLEKFVELYKKRGSINVFTTEETDSIIQVLKSMPGYTSEKFLTVCSAINGIGDDKIEVFQWSLYVTYTMLSITNPELFEKDEEEEND